MLENEWLAEELVGVCIPDPVIVEIDAIVDPDRVSRLATAVL